jgi:hypothetical protein
MGLVTETLLALLRKQVVTFAGKGLPRYNPVVGQRKGA